MFKECFDFSYTDLKNYTACKYRFFLSYKLRMSKIYPKSPNSRMFLEGWCVHKCLELWNRMGKFEPKWMSSVIVSVKYRQFTEVGRDENETNLVPEVIKLYMQDNDVTLRDNEDVDTVAANIYSGIELVEHYITSYGMNHDKLESEHKFRVLLPDLNIVAKGSIDIVDHGLQDIHDMKFSKRGYTDLKQLIWYKKILEAETGKKFCNVYTFNPLQKNPFEIFDYTSTDLAEFDNELKEAIENIRSGKFEANVSNECFNCLVGSHCKHNAFTLNRE